LPHQSEAHVTVPSPTVKDELVKASAFYTIAGEDG